MTALSGPGRFGEAERRARLQAPAGPTSSGVPSVTLQPAQMRRVLGWKVSEYVGLALFAVIVPPLMGPERYGRFAGLLAVVTLMTVVSGLGALPTFGRFVPEYRVSGEDDKIRLLFTQLFASRLVVALVLAGVFAVGYPRLASGVSGATVTMAALALIAAVPAATCFQLFHGLNDMGRWLCQDALIKAALLVGLLVSGGIYDIERAALVLLVTHAAFLVLGLWWARPYFTLARDVGDGRFLYGHVRFGLLFFLAGLFLTAVWRLGELSLLVFGLPSTEIAYFSVANAVALLMSTLIAQLAAILTPSLAAFHVASADDRLNDWLGESMKYLLALAFVFLFAVHALGAWAVDLVWGADYRPVADNLEVLAFGVLTFPFLRTVMSLAIVRSEAAKLFRVAAVACVSYVAAATIMVPWQGSRGASLAIAISLVVAAVAAHRFFPLGEAVRSSRLATHLVLGAVSCLPLLLPGPSVVGGALAGAAYVGLVLGTGVIAPAGLRRLATTLRPERRTSSTGPRPQREHDDAT